MIPPLGIRVRYSCHECGLELREIEVPARDPREDVTDWLTTVMLYVGADHSSYSPNCRSTHCDLRVPGVKEGQPIGTASKH